MAALVLLGSAVAGCALIAGVPDVDLAPSIADSGARPPSDADDTLDEGTLDSGPRCRSEDAFERGVVEIGSLNVRGRCGSVHLTADENVAAVSSFVDGLSPSPESSWAVFTLTRSGAGTYGSQMQQMMAGSAALRDDGLALVVSPDAEGKGAFREYGRPRLDGVFAASGEVTSLQTFDVKRNPIFAGPDALFFDGKRTAASAPQVFRLRRIGGKLDDPQGLDGLPAGAGTPVPTRETEVLYFSTCDDAPGTRCAPFRSKRTTRGGIRYASVTPMEELGDFRPRWISVDGCRLYGTRANRPTVATKLPR